MLDILKQLKVLESQFIEWEENVPRAWKYNVVAWVDDSDQEGIDGEGLEDMAEFPGRRDEYVDISIATAYNIMRASRIMC